MSIATEPLLGAIEAGGTKFNLCVASDPDLIEARHTIPTRNPAETLAEAAEWFAAQEGLAALGIASFGPLELNRAAPKWGHITTTPKPGWSNCDIVGFFNDRLGVPIELDTDVNAAALAEHRAAGSEGGSLAYVTVGTGVGGGLVIEGRPVHGAAHPELGHLFPRRRPDDTGFNGVCPFHGECLEGLASGPAIIARWGSPLSDLPPDHEAHRFVAYYLAELCHGLFATAAIETVVLGGGVMQTPGLIENVRSRTHEIDHSYLPGRARQLIRAPVLGNDAGIRGALLLARALLV